MQEKEFSKYQAIGNDFIIIDDLKKQLRLSAEQVTGLCDRHFGIGADGLILIRPSEKSSFAMAYYNADGSPAEMCGNGIRCLGKYVYDHSLTPKSDLLIETGAGDREVSLIREGEVVVEVRVDMGSPRFKRQEIPMVGDQDGEVINQALDIKETTLQITCLSIGNPHCVIFVENTEHVGVGKVGPIIERLPVFPERTNVEFVQLVGPRELKVRVWERGVGETLACGTGACASVVASVRNNFSGRKVTVRLRGGDLKVEWSENNHVYLTGPCEEVFRGVVEV
jgi:diaminopimelate epimerase